MCLTDIVIPTYNLEQYSIQCLASIYRNTDSYRVIWIDNGSSRSSQQAVARMLAGIPHIEIKNEHNLGFVRAVNQGLEVSNNEFVVILNNDTIVTHGWLDRMKRVFSEDPATGLVGPLTSTEGSWQGVNRLRRDARFQDDFSDLPYLDPNLSPEEASILLHKASHGQKVEVKGMLAFFCVLTTRQVIEEVGYLSEEFSVGFCDDDDYCHRVRKAGYRLYVAKDAFVYHYHRTTFRLLYSDSDVGEMIRTNKRLFKEKWNVSRMPFYKEG